MIERLRLAASCLMALLAAPALATPNWIVQPESQVGFTARRAGQAVEGVFQDFQAEIAFDPQDLAGSRVVVTIETGSVDTQSKDRDEVIRSTPFFDVASHPTARFAADRFEPQPDGGYIAHGRLTLRGVTREVALPFRLDIAPDASDPATLRAEAAGDVRVSRIAFGVGQGEWQSTDVVADEVVIGIDLVATRPAG